MVFNSFKFAILNTPSEQTSKSFGKIISDFVNSTRVFAMYCLLQETDSNKETTQTIIRILNLFIVNYKINCKSRAEAEPLGLCRSAA